MNSTNKCLYFLTLICAVVIFSCHEVTGAAEKSLAMNVQKNEQCPCEKCENKWFRSWRSDGAHPDTKQEKCLVYLWQALPQGSFTNGKLPPLVNLVLDYAADPTFGEYKKETWRDVHSVRGLFRNMSWPAVECGYMIGNPMTHVDWVYSKIKLVDDSLQFNAEDIKNFEQYVLAPDSNNTCTMTSVCQKYRIEASPDWPYTTKIKTQVRLDHEQRINQLITLLVEQAQAQKAKIATKKEQQSKDNEQCPCEECNEGWFSSWRSNTQHPYTATEKALASALMSTSLAPIPSDQDENGQLSRVTQLILDYYGADQWLEINHCTGVFRNMSWPAVECGYMIGNDKTGIDWIYSKIKLVDDGKQFHNEDIKKVIKFIQTPALNRVCAMTSVCQNYRVEASLGWPCETQIKTQVRLRSSQRIPILITNLRAEQEKAQKAKAQKAKAVVKKEPSASCLIS